MNPRAARDPLQGEATDASWLPPPPARAGENPARNRQSTARSARTPLQQREALLLAAVLAVALLGLSYLLAQQPYLDARWRQEPPAAVQLLSSPLPALRELQGARLQRIAGAAGQSIDVDAGLLHRSARWSVDDLKRQRQLEQRLQLAQMLQQGPVSLHFGDRGSAELQPKPRGLLGLGFFYWVLNAAAAALVLTAAAVLRTEPKGRNLPYALIALSQATNLVLIAIETLPGLGLPTWLGSMGAGWHGVLDLCSAAALVHLATLQPLRLPRGRWIAATAWTGCALLSLALLQGILPAAWWWTQAAMLACGAVTIALMTWSYSLEPNPFALLMRRLAAAATVTLLLLSVAVLAADADPAVAQGEAALSSVAWYLFLATLILVLPVFSRVKPMMRELMLLAGTSTVVASLNLLFSGLFGLSGIVALALSVLVGLGTYAGTRRWLLQPVRGRHALGLDRMFGQLYRVLREVEARPQDSGQLLTGLLRELFEPMQVHTLEGPASRSRVLGEGSALLVPLPRIDATHAPANDGSIVLRFAEQGQRMFSRDDAQLCDRVVEQLRRAVAYDKAVERGRNEERARIAQDLHDDIGARLLTLMYKAQTPEMEDYLRNTLKDLKTLTRGLAASEHYLSHAAAEWKADIGQRLAAAQIELRWNLSYDRDIVLGVVQWSALTRVLRELVSNVVQHSCATQLELSIALDAGRLRLTLADDGIGRAPQRWSLGLGLGGVRKRVKLLGGDVQWRENGSAGIVCTVVVAELAGRDAARP